MPVRKLIPFETVQRSPDSVRSPESDRSPQVVSTSGDTTCSQAGDAEGLAERAWHEPGAEVRCDGMASEARRWLAPSTPVPRAWELRLEINPWTAFSAGALVVAVAALAFAAGQWWGVSRAVDQAAQGKTLEDIRRKPPLHWEKLEIDRGQREKAARSPNS